MFVQGSVTYDQEEATFIAVAEDGHTVGELFVDETVGYDARAVRLRHPYRAIVTAARLVRMVLNACSAA